MIRTLSVTMRAAAAALALAIAAPVSAGTYIITYQGTVASGIDPLGIFGGGALDGLAFTAEYTLTYPGGETTNFVGTDASGYIETLGYNAGNPLLGKLIINNLSYQMGGYFGYAYQGNNWAGGYDQVFHDVASTDFAEYFYVDIYTTVTDFISTRDLTAPLDYTVQPGGVATGAFHMVGTGAQSGSYTDGVLTPTFVSIREIPEPATWAMMVFGFGAAGWAMRRRWQAHRLVSFA